MVDAQKVLRFHTEQKPPTYIGWLLPSWGTTSTYSTMELHPVERHPIIAHAGTVCKQGRCQEHVNVGTSSELPWCE